MHFITSALVWSILFAPAVLAIPSSRYGARAIRRREGRRPQPNNRLEQRTSDVSGTPEYSINWAGAVCHQDNAMFSLVEGTFTVPTPSGENGAAASVWVGIDGDTCTNVALQAGINFILNNGEASYQAWYEWYPEPVYDFTGIDIFAGDVIKVTVAAYSGTSGNVMVENLTRSQTVSQTLTSTTALCRQDAEWIVQNFALNNVLTPLANFGTVTFTDAEAIGDEIFTPSDAIIVDIQQNDQILTSVSTSEYSVTVQYV